MSGLSCFGSARVAGCLRPHGMEAGGGALHRKIGRLRSTSTAVGDVMSL